MMYNGCLLCIDVAPLIHRFTINGSFTKTKAKTKK